MAVFRCKSCGAPLKVKQGETIVTCLYCDLQQTIPTLDDEFKTQMFNQANELRRQFDFDGAKSFLQAIIARYPQEAEAYWEICLCKYGIMYVEDPQTRKQIPTFYKMIPQSILSDDDYLKAYEYGGYSAWKYEEEAKYINSLQSKINSISNTESPYDIFICYKKTEINTGAKTYDSKIANQLYTRLIESGYRVFWAERSLPAGCEYEPYIYSALSSAKVMLLISSDERYFEATWVKNEWIRFLDMMKRDNTKKLITCYQNMTAEKIPASLRNLQALDMSSTLFSSDLLQQLERMIPKKKSTTETASGAMQYFMPDQLALANGVYKGDVVAGKPHGKGTYHMSNGDRYEGEWNVGNKHGKGTFYYNKGNLKWSGEWNNDRPFNGSGTYIQRLKTRYVTHEGTMKNGGLCGEGKMYVTEIDDGRVYPLCEGSFENGQLHGHGTLYRKDGKYCTGEFNHGKPWNAEGVCAVHGYDAIFEGKWVKGQPDGKGIAVFKANKVIEGYFENGLNGNLTITYHDDRRYIGQVHGAVPHGNGKMFAKDGFCIFAGDYRNGTMTNGCYWFRDGRCYNGAISNEKQHGIGTLHYPNGRGCWMGEWKDGIAYNGQGIIMLYDKNEKPTGDAYVGIIVNGKEHGNGIRYISDGGRAEGVFSNGNIERGIHYKPDGGRYEGTFYDDGKYYTGTLYNKAGAIEDKYENGLSQKLDKLTRKAQK